MLRTFRGSPDHGVSAHNVTGKLEDLKLALELPADMSIRSFVDRGAVVFEVPKMAPTATTSMRPNSLRPRKTIRTPYRSRSGRTSKAESSSSTSPLRTPLTY